MFKQKFFKNWKRRSTQAISLVVLGEWSFYGIFRCPFAVPYIGCGNCPVVQCPGRSLWMGSWIFILASALLAGRFFCGWVCPVGTISDLLGALAFAKQRVKGMLKTVLGYGKYLMLIAALVFFFMLNNPRWAIPIRTGEFFRSIQLTFEHAQPLWIYKTLFFIGALALGGVIPHFWCRFLCPTGGALNLFRKISLFNFRKTAECNDCNRCQKHCQHDTRPEEENCVNCGDCVENCLPRAINFEMGRSTETKESA